jgi:hypothetical protein
MILAIFAQIVPSSNRDILQGKSRIASRELIIASHREFRITRRKNDVRELLITVYKYKNTTRTTTLPLNRSSSVFVIFLISQVI